MSSTVYVGERGATATVYSIPALAELAGWLLTKGAERLSITALEQAFDARNTLYEALESRIGREVGSGADGVGAKAMVPSSWRR